MQPLRTSSSQIPTPMLSTPSFWSVRDDDEWYNQFAVVAQTQYYGSFRCMINGKRCRYDYEKEKAMKSLLWVSTQLSINSNTQVVIFDSHTPEAMVDGSIKSRPSMLGL
ncbi:hypothetical protein BHYA_0278g00030 [Botrytis hyacinthi]|uniref:Uncharacterized protein n=1 Tax=Botrytis hyacinthi TaxID=278943 RepID=A0A4Z1GGB3_9HELO|nr:hypothetical protein BHYA_0278g00030 [Botrytis hyacinthi]